MGSGPRGGQSVRPMEAKARAWAAGPYPVRETGPLVMDFDATLVEAHCGAGAADKQPGRKRA
jgi:hypothetical protein